jgi:hypothetical protein
MRSKQLFNCIHSHKAVLIELNSRRCVCYIGVFLRTQYAPATEWFDSDKSGLFFYYFLLRSGKFSFKALCHVQHWYAAS